MRSVSFLFEGFPPQHTSSLQSCVQEQGILLQLLAKVITQSAYIDSGIHNTSIQITLRSIRDEPVEEETSVTEKTRHLADQVLKTAFAAS